MSVSDQSFQCHTSLFSQMCFLRMPFERCVFSTRVRHKGTTQSLSLTVHFNGCVSAFSTHVTTEKILIGCSTTCLWVASVAHFSVSTGFVPFLNEWSNSGSFWQYNTIQYNTIQYNTIQYNTIQYNTIQYNTIQYNTIQYNMTVFWPIPPLHREWLRTGVKFKMEFCLLWGLQELYLCLQLPDYPNANVGRSFKYKMKIQFSFNSANTALKIADCLPVILLVERNE